MADVLPSVPGLNLTLNSQASCCVALWRQCRHYIRFFMLVMYGPAGENQQVAAIFSGASYACLGAQPLFLRRAAIGVGRRSEHQHGATRFSNDVCRRRARDPMRGFACRAHASKHEQRRSNQPASGRNPVAQAQEATLHPWSYPSFSGESRSILVSRFVVMRCTRSSGPVVRPICEPAGACPGGIARPSGHQMVPALKTQLPFGPG